MKLTTDGVKAGLLLAVAGIAGYVAYKAYRTGANALEGASEVIGSIKESVSNTAGRISDMVSDVFGTEPGTVPDLRNSNQGPPPPLVLPANDEVPGYSTVTAQLEVRQYNQPQDYSPSALFTGPVQT